MASADVALKVDHGNRLWFAHSPMRAFFFALVGAGFALVCWLTIRDEALTRYALTGFCLLFVAVGAIGVFWRMELDIDLATRRVRTRRGFWPSPRTSERGLDAADGVWLKMEYRSAGSKSRKRQVPWWFVSLEFPGEEKGTRLFATRDEAEGYRKWEYYAQRLAIDAVDATAEPPTRKSWRHLDKSLGAKARRSDVAPSRAPNQPADSEVVARYNGGRKEFVLPAAGFNAGVVFLALFGAAFIALGGGALLASAGFLDIPVEGSEWAVRVVPVVFVLIGLGIVSLGIVGSYSVLVVGVERGKLFIERVAFGRHYGRRAVALAEIEAVGVGGDVRTRQRTGGYVRIGGVALGKGGYRDREVEVVVRSDRRILRFGGSLSAADKAWLAEVCQWATIRGQLP